MRFLALLSSLFFCGAATAAADEVEVSVDGGAAALYGTLATPTVTQTGPAVLLIAGSGPTDRDGNSTLPGVRPATLKLLADVLLASNIPSVRYDKRAVAKSAPAAIREADLRFDRAVKDAIAFAELLRRRPGVTCVVFVGHSEGGLIAAMAAKRTASCGVVELAATGRPLGAVLREQLERQLPPELLAQAALALREMEAGREAPNVPGLEALFRPSVQPYLISQINIDPAAELRDVPVPVLIVQGDRDLQTTVADARALASARPDAVLLIVPGANHVLKSAPADRPGNIATYMNPELPLAPGVAEAVVSFVRAAKPQAAQLNVGSR